jgi:hypothetical protein
MQNSFSILFKSKKTAILIYSNFATSFPFLFNNVCLWICVFPFCRIISTPAQATAGGTVCGGSAKYFIVFMKKSDFFQYRNNIYQKFNLSLIRAFCLPQSHLAHLHW